MLLSPRGDPTGDPKKRSHWRICWYFMMLLDAGYSMLGYSLVSMPYAGVSTLVSFWSLYMVSICYSHAVDPRVDPRS
jgi:hypothetical protein